MPAHIPTMAVTIQVEGGPTVCLTYHGGRDGRSIVPYTSVMIGEQAPTRGPGYLYDLLIHAGSLLLLYAAQEEDWPPDLRPASRRPDEP